MSKKEINYAHKKLLNNNLLIDVLIIRRDVQHTFATTITLNNNVPIETVSKVMGHSKISTTQIYAKILQSKVNEDFSKLSF